ncbi:MAG: tetratricopeptide repeat protein, partial [Armatimonadota bacterium]
FDKGQDYLYNNDYHNAALYFEKAVKANPDHLDALKSLNKVYKKLGHHPESLKRIDINTCFCYN